MPGRKSNKEEMEIDWGSALDSLELSPIPIERQEIWNGTEIRGHYRRSSDRREGWYIRYKSIILRMLAKLIEIF